MLDVVIPSCAGGQAPRILRTEDLRYPPLMVTLIASPHCLDTASTSHLGQAEPFDVEEVIVRVRTLLERAVEGISVPHMNPPQCALQHMGPSELAQAQVDHRYIQVADLRLDVPGRRVWHGEHEMNLTRTEFDLLELLARNTGIVLTRGAIYERIWGYDGMDRSKNLAVYVGYLRRKLDGVASSVVIHTIRGIGYVLRSTD
ncbi:response regulator transcription factor [Streptomyces sp. NPDC001817]|uniref:response regulator transcription factor n=1 Tax=Streptomyces sp. NPDC001817 TaxID=3154398 RepID=UPI00331C1200